MKNKSFNQFSLIKQCKKSGFYAGMALGVRGNKKIGHLSSERASERESRIYAAECKALGMNGYYDAIKTNKLRMTSDIYEWTN